MYSNLALSGGALRSVSLLGAIKYLEEINILKDFKNYIGTSAGGIILFFLLIGYTSNEIYNILKDEISYLTKIDFDNLSNIYTDLGIDDSKKNENILRKYLYAKVNLDSITFIEFAKKFGYNLIITGTNLDTQNTDYFSVNTFPNMDVVQALLITSCIPIIYKPITFNDNLYIDGGIYSNFPIEYFKKHSNDTLGICINPESMKNNDTIINYLTNILFSMMNKLSYDNIHKNKNEYNICLISFKSSCIDDISFSFEDMEIKTNDKIFEEYMDYGYKEFKKYYEKD
tara:strand:+ start:2085 stop:2939 length:855 start_codon:yes stop_codon:yes gene_type:complete